MAATRHYRTLDGMRGLAAVAVMLWHVQPKLMPGGQLVPGGPLAVDFFFVLSGFVMMHAYGAQLLNGLGLRRFAFKRLIRLYPLCLLGGLMSLALLLARIATYRSSPHALITGAANLVLILLPIGPLEYLYPLNVVFWSLAFEAVANLAFALFPRVSASPRRLAMVVAVSGLALSVVAIAGGTTDLGVYWSGALGGIARVAFSFSAGVLVYHLHRRFALRLPPLALPLLIAALLVLLAAPAMWSLAWRLPAILIALPTIVFLSASVEPGRRTLPLMTFSGELSYALYAVHFPIVDAMVLAAAKLDLPKSVELGLAAMALSGLVAWLAARFYDAPLRAWLSNAWTMRRSLAAASTP